MGKVLKSLLKIIFLSILIGFIVWLIQSVIKLILGWIRGS